MQPTSPPQDQPIDLRAFWGHATGDFRPGGDHYPALVDALRRLQDAVTCSDPGPEHAAAAELLIEKATEVLLPARVEPGRHFAGLRGDLAGRGHPLVVPMRLDELTVDHAHGRVEFTPFYLGGGIAAHGGAIALMFDDILGRLANAGQPSRTAYLHVDYRRVVPVGRELEVHAHITRTEGRKIFVEGAITLDGIDLAESHGLWVVLRDDATPEEQGVTQ